MRKSVPIVAACLTAFATGATLSVAVPAQAERAIPSVKVTRYDRAHLRFGAGSNSSLRKSMQAAKTDYLDWSARRGRNLDSQRVQSVSDATGSVVATSDTASVIDGINVGSYSQANVGGAIGAGVITHETNDDVAGAAAPVIGFAVGMAARAMSIGVGVKPNVRSVSAESSRNGRVHW